MWPIIFFAIISIFFFALYFILRVHFNAPARNKNNDYISRFINKKQNEVEIADTGFKLIHYLVTIIVAPLTMAAIGYMFTHNPVMACIFAGVGLYIPRLIISVLVKQKQKRFDERYLRSLDQLSSDLKAGLTIYQAIDDVAECKFVHEDLRRKYARISADLQMGIPLNEAFKRFAASVNSVDARDVALAIEIQGEIGGHEAEVVESVSENIRTRINMKKELASIFSETFATVRPLDFIPIALEVGMTVTNKSYLEYYLSGPTKTLILVGCVALPLFGSIQNHRMLNRVSKGA